MIQYKDFSLNISYFCIIDSFIRFLRLFPNLEKYVSRYSHSLIVVLSYLNQLQSKRWECMVSPLESSWGQKVAALLRRQGSPGRLTGSVKTWLLLYSEAMRSVFSQPDRERFYRVGGVELYITPHFVTEGISSSMIDFIILVCFNFEVFHF